MTVKELIEQLKAAKSLTKPDTKVVITDGTGSVWEVGSVQLNIVVTGLDTITIAGKERVKW